MRRLRFALLTLALASASLTLGACSNPTGPAPSNTVVGGSNS